MRIAKEVVVALGMAIVLLFACGESPYTDLPGKTARVDSLIVKARNQGNHSLDSLRQEQKVLAERFSRSVDPARVDSADISAAARLYYYAGRLDSSIAVLQRPLLDSLDIRDAVMLFEMYWSKDRIADAEKLFRRVLNPADLANRDNYYYYLFHGYKNIDDYERALQIAAEALQLMTLESGLSLALDKGELLWSVGKRAEALEWLDLLKTQYNENPPALGRIQAQENLFNLIGKTAPEFTASVWIDSQPLSLSDLRGKVVLIDFWAPWCGPCRATFPHLKSLYRDYRDKGLEIIGLSRTYGFFNQLGQSLKNLDPEQEVEWIEKFKAEHEIPFPYAIADSDAGRDNAIRYGVSGIPHLVLVDKSGRVRMYAIGSGKATEKKLSQGIIDLLAE